MTINEALKTTKKQIPQRVLPLTFAIPVLIGKSTVIYFGLNYSEYPDEGYGYGLGATAIWVKWLIAFFFHSYMIWKLKNQNSNVSA